MDAHLSKDELSGRLPVVSPHLRIILGGRMDHGVMDIRARAERDRVAKRSRFRISVRREGLALGGSALATRRPPSQNIHCTSV
jgi:hypothetical protein